MNENIFRAYDIRGIYPSEINENIAYLIGQGYGSYLKEKYYKDTCIVSHDNRLSSDTLTENLIKGIISTGVNVINYGLTTTPMNYYARSVNNLPGIMVTASHNPKDDNGFKFSFDGMVNARGEMIDDFKNYILRGNFLTGNGEITNKSITEEYLNYLFKSISFGPNKRKIVIDPGNGVTCTIIKEVFNRIPHDVKYINDISDGSFPNHHPDPSVKENMRQLQIKVMDEQADFGIAYDGDGDRIGIVSNDGSMLPIEYFMLINIENIINKVDNKTFLYDIKCSKCIDDYVSKLRGNTICYRTGASYTQYKVHEDNLPFGLEYSGHVYFNDRDIECGSAIYASLRFIEIMSYTNQKLSDIITKYPKYESTPEIKIPSDDNKKFNVVDKIKQYAIDNKLKINDIDGVRITYKDGWVLIRASNTGPNITFRIESTSKERLEELFKEYMDLINNYNETD